MAINPQTSAATSDYLQSARLSQIVPQLTTAAYLPLSTPVGYLKVVPSKLATTVVFLSNSTMYQLTVLSEIAAIDNLLHSEKVDARFSLQYVLLSHRYNHRKVLTVSTNEVTPVPSLATPLICQQKIFASADWLEREVWDLYGVQFTGHSDLRRILTDYGFESHPLRKDFPLTGFHEVVYDDTEGRIVIDLVELSQEFRVFHL
jgi:NADH:ubiquinone oxidoreductase subunit C